MTYDEYWYGDPLMVRAYYKAEKLRQERMDEEAWLNGLYVMRALDAVVGNMFRDKNAEKAEYPDMPILQEQKMEAEKTEEQEEQEAVWALAWMNNFVDAGKGWDKKIQ